MKKAMLVRFGIVTRVIVDDTATEDEIIEAAAEKVNKPSYDLDLIENVESVEEDKECPYNPLEKVEDKMRNLHHKFKVEHGHNPKFASVVLKFDGEDEQFTDTIKLEDWERDNTENDPDDNDVIFYAEGLEELIAINRDNLTEFKITDINEFMDSIW